MEHTKCLIIGSGPGGYTAAIYASRSGLNPVLFEGYQLGGQLTTTGEVENFPGFPEGVQGAELVELMRQQAERFGADIRPGYVGEIDVSSRPYKVRTDDDQLIAAETVIVATGATARYLGLKDEERLMGRGVSACATCDGFFYRGKRVAVVGGGDTACEEALYLSNLAKEVFQIVRRGELRASKVMRERVFAKDNIKVLFFTQTEGLEGEEFLTGAQLVEHRGEPDERHYTLPIDGFFLAIGHDPQSGFLPDEIARDAGGYVITAPDSTATSVPGIFAAGDVADPHYQQAICAAAAGCRAAIDAEQFILDNPVK